MNHLDKTRITSVPLDLELIHGNQATFWCVASTDVRTTLRYKWLRNGVEVDDADPRVNIEEGSLTILNISSKDTANYTCVAHNGIDNDTATAKLQVQAPPAAPYNVVLTACYANSAIVEWSFDKTQENYSPLQGFIVEYNTSFMPNEWVVSARTSSHSRSTEIKLSHWVTYSFRVKAFNEIGVGEAGDIYSVVCRTPPGRPDRHPRNVQTVGGKPNFLVIEWETMPQIEHNAPDFFYGIEVKEKDGDSLMNLREHDYTVGRLEIYTDTIYQPYIIRVRAGNRLGQSFIQAMSIIGYSGEAAPSVVPTNFELDTEMNVTATSARFRWDPVITTTGVMNGKYKGYKIRYWKRNQREASLREVFIPDSVEANMKQRLRHADNKVWAEIHNLPSDSDIEADVVVVNTYFSSEGSNTINFSTPEGDKTRITSVPLDLELIHGNEATFWCGASTDLRTTLRYKWLRNGVEIDDADSRVNIEEGSLTILNISSKDTANYTCVAHNGIDNDTATAKLQVQAPPAAPYNVVLAACYANRAIVEWSFDKTQENYSPLQGFIVEYNTSFTPNEWVVSARTSSHSRSTEIKLSHWVTYSFRVKAINKIGVGEAGDIYSVVCRTPPGRPDRHPRNVQTVGGEPKFLVIEWETMPQIEHNAPDFFYGIEVKEKDGDSLMNLREHDYTVGRLEIYTDTIYQPYIIRVRAGNRLGQSSIQVMSINGYSGEAAPSVVPTNFELDTEMNVTATSARFRWDPVITTTGAMPLYPNCVDDVNHWIIRYWKRNQREASLREVFIPDSTDVSIKQRLRHADNNVWTEVHNLPSDSDIEADVVVVNTYFSSEGSNTINFSTPEGVPSPVEYFNAPYRGSVHLLLEWGEPKESNGHLIGYQVGYMKIDGLEFGDLEISEIVTKRRMFLGGLTPDTMYRVHVWGLTKEGRGKDFFLETRTAEDTSDIARPVIDYVVPTITTVNVTWNIPDIKGVRAGAYYFLEYRELGNTDWDRVIEEERESFWQEIKGLESGTSYQVRVATRAGQPGNPSYREEVSDIRMFTTTYKAFLLLSQGKSMKRVDMATASSRLVSFTEKKKNMMRPVSLTFNVRNNIVFWVDKRSKSINMATIEGLQLLSALRIYQDYNSSVVGMAYDWVHNAIYWIDSSRKAIRVMTLAREDRKYTTTVLDAMGKPRAIALDIQDRYIYWTDRKKPAMIGRCGMDGSNRSTIIDSDITLPNGLTIDHAERRLFWTDAKRDTVSSSDMDGGNRKVVIRMSGPPDELMFGITMFQGYIPGDIA
ncbi:neuroglian-like [Haliotis cracherodii]|uniref:neuroglian-like n=1 Tax=Haliotis cracherodii TaxID=6455 RepID=UPI0039E8E64E